jgi:magnesium transporter
MNEIMKILTIVSAIFIPLTFIVGIYGMNFEYMPELKKKYGYATVLIVMAISAILMFLYFVKKGWLKKSDYHLDNE